MTNTNDISAKEIKATLWRRGILRWKCHSIQKEMYDLFYKLPAFSIPVWLLARQTGKSYLLGILALEHALKKENSIIKLVTDTKLHVKSIFEKIFLELMEDMPDDIKPDYHPSEFTYYFPNGSQIQMAGTDNKNYQRLRGQKSVLVLVDEAGFCNDLEDVIYSVLLPTTTHTGGKVVLATTPPEESDHPFFSFQEKAELEGMLVKKTIDDNPLLNEEQKKNIETKMGGRNSPRFRREYLCENVRDASRTVIPEFTPELEKLIVRDHPMPPYYDNYVSMDIGGKDFTVVLFGYFDFRSDKIIIQDEISMDFTAEGNTMKTLAENIDNKEISLWTNIYTNEIRRPYKRISDIDYIAVKEIRTHKPEITFLNTDKDDKTTAINNVRTLLQAGKIIIDPKCKTLIRHLANVKWKSAANKVEFSRSPDNGHYDAVDALIYFVRNVDYKRNPYPAGYDLNLKEDAYYVHGSRSAFEQNYRRNQYNNSGNSTIDVYKKIFGIKKR